jgi:vancomycin resistance protein YoaR
VSTDSVQTTEVPGEDAPPVIAPSRRRLIVGAALAAAIVLYAGLAWAMSSRVPYGTTVAGVEIGGQSRDDAHKRLEAAASAQTDGGLPVIANGHTATLDLSTAGLSLDADATLDELVGFSLNPITLVKHFFGDDEQPALPKPDEAVLEAALAVIAEAVAAPAADASIAYVKGKPVLTPAVTGTALQPADAAVEVRRSWLAGARPLPLPTDVKQPEITQQEGEDALAKLAQPAVSAPLTVKVGNRSVSVPAAKLAPALTLTPKDGVLALTVDGAKLRTVVLEAGPEIATKPKDAEIVVKKGKPTVIPGVAGVTVDPAALAAAVLPALTDKARTATLESAVKEPDLTTEEAVKLGVKEKISTFSTIYPPIAGRTENLRLAARTVDGTLVLPGETFSLNGVLGKRTPEKGYHQAPAISGGRLVNDYGGGVSQMATTIFNNVFFSGLEDVYHKPHSFYISRYPEGREATVNYPSVDLKWRNDSDTAVLIKANVTNTVNVSFYGTKTWDIEASRSGRSNFRTPKTVYDDQPGCVSQGANGGFDVSVTRTFRKPGSKSVVKKETFNAVYNAEDQIICGPAPASSPKPR